MCACSPTRPRADSRRRLLYWVWDHHRMNDPDTRHSQAENGAQNRQRCCRRSRVARRHPIFDELCPGLLRGKAAGPRIATARADLSGGEGGIRTHEHPLRCYWNSSPAPSTARPPLLDESIRARAAPVLAHCIAYACGGFTAFGTTNGGGKSRQRSECVRAGGGG
jgi:hypothetical protein